MNRRGEWGQNLPPKLCIEDATAEQTGQKRKYRRGNLAKKDSEANKITRKGDEELDEKDTQKTNPVYLEIPNEKDEEAPAPKKRKKTPKWESKIEQVPMRSVQLSVKEIMRLMKLGPAKKQNGVTENNSNTSCPDVTDIM